MTCRDHFGIKLKLVLNFISGYFQKDHNQNINVDKLEFLWNFGKKYHIFPKLSADTHQIFILSNYFFIL